jgi:hypothetical protein
MVYFVEGLEVGFKLYFIEMVAMSSFLDTFLAHIEIFALIAMISRTLNWRNLASVTCKAIMNIPYFINYFFMLSHREGNIVVD